MRIEIKNEYGKIVIGERGGAKLVDIAGLGAVEKEAQTVTYAGQPGQTTLSLRDMPRTITMSIDFCGDRDAVLKLYRILYGTVRLVIFSGENRRAINGNCINQYDVEQIIYRQMYKVTVQFVCDDPYFHDVSEVRFDLNRREDKLPNLQENGEWYVTLPTAATVRTNGSGVINKGIAAVYPIIEITNNTAEAAEGEQSGLIITNGTIGATIGIERDMKPSELITIDLPRRRIISSVDGSITKHISDDTVLSEFYLAPGGNDITVINKNEKQVISTVISFNNNYEAAVI